MRLLPWLAAGGASLLLLASSCAESDPLEATDPPDASTVLDAGSDEHANVDADCGTNDGGCPAAPPCEGTDFCPMTVTINGRYLLTAIWGSSKDDVWAAGAAGIILHWDGAAWTSIKSGIANTLRAVSGS
ncbi:MAG: Type fimbrial biosis protein PilY1, partial [Labilithrix sp.]|nr:Type fimbrial biosis protein PilY1 [Labilithrix sp.]